MKKKILAPVLLLALASLSFAQLGLAQDDVFGFGGPGHWGPGHGPGGFPGHGGQYPGNGGQYPGNGGIPGYGPGNGGHYPGNGGIPGYGPGQGGQYPGYGGIPGYGSGNGGQYPGNGGVYPGNGAYPGGNPGPGYGGNSGQADCRIDGLEVQAGGLNLAIQNSCLDPNTKYFATAFAQAVANVKQCQDQFPGTFGYCNSLVQLVQESWTQLAQSFSAASGHQYPQVYPQYLQTQQAFNAYWWQ